MVVVVPGDVNSTLAGALAAAKLQIPVCHVESGLRSFDWSMPEEHNRRHTDHLSTLLLTHCEDANENLRAEGVPEDLVHLVGNTMIDTLLATVDTARAAATWLELGVERQNYVLVTLHRPALVDSPTLLLETMSALSEIAATMPVVFPVHPRTRSRLAELGFVAPPQLLLVDPQPYTQFLSLEVGAAAVVTDSGGVQEETTALGIPCFTLRDNTERPVTVTYGNNVLLGLDPGRIRRCPSCWRATRPVACRRSGTARRESRRGGDRAVARGARPVRDRPPAAQARSRPQRQRCGPQRRRGHNATTAGGLAVVSLSTDGIPRRTGRRRARGPARPGGPPDRPRRHERSHVPSRRS